MIENSIDKEHIDHHGTVTAISGGGAAGGPITATVRLEGNHDCSGCRAAALCGMAGKDSDTLNVTLTDHEAGRLHVGDRVTLRGTERMHRRAIMLATVLPCVTLVAVMVALYLLTGSQPVAALGGLAAMVIFFIVLFLARNRVAHEFSFTVAESHRPK